jgi:hypothetical protein
MRIKSYFAPSVQSAISIARKEFGDEVTLVTSHMAALESRHLGDYEVVFAVDEPATVEPTKPAQLIKAVATASPEPESPKFEAVLEEALAQPLSTEENVPAKLERVRTLLMEMGVDAAMLRALMTMIERTVGVSSATENCKLETENCEPEIAMCQVDTGNAQAETGESAPAEPVVEASPLPNLTPAELAFYLAVSVGS